MNSAVIQEFFGWCTIINFGVLAFVGLLLIIGQKEIVKIHSRILSINENELPKIYMNYLANYKLGVIIFSLAPYIALRIMS